MATLSIWKFTSPDGAEQAMRTLVRLQDERLITIQDASVVSWPEGRRKPRTWQARDLVGPAALSTSAPWTARSAWRPPGSSRWPPTRSPRHSAASRWESR